MTFERNYLLAINERQMRMESLLLRILERLGTMGNELDDLKQAVADSVAAMQAGVTAIQAAEQEIQTLQANPQVPAGTLEGLAQQLETARTALAGAIPATPTPAAPAAPTDPNATGDASQNQQESYEETIPHEPHCSSFGCDEEGNQNPCDCPKAERMARPKA